MPTELDRCRTALRATCYALLAFLIAGIITQFLGTGTPLGAIVSLVGLVLLINAFVKVRAADYGRRPPRG